MTPEVKERIAQIRLGNVPDGYKKLGKDIIPMDWKKKPFSELGIIASGLVDPREEQYCHMQHIGPENIEKDTGRVLNTQTAAELGLISGKFYFDSASIVYSKIRPNLNKVCAPKFEGVCSADCYSIKPTEAINKTYLLNLMLGYRFYKRAVECSMRTGMPKINQDDLNIITMCYPESIAEQKRIAEILTAQDKVIELKEKLLAEKQRQKKYLMQQLLTGKKRLAGFEGEWKKYLFSDIFTGITSKSHQINSTMYLTEGKYPVVDQGKKKIVGFSNNEAKVLSCPDGGVIVFGDHTREIKYVNFDFIVGADGTQLLISKTGKTSTIYLYYLLCSKNIPNDGYSRHLKYVKEFTYLLPGQEEQREIVAVLSDADREIDLLHQNLDQEKQKKKALMQLLLTGIVRV